MPARPVAVTMMALTAVLTAVGSAAALEVRVRTVHAAATVVSAQVDVEDLVPDRLKHVMDDGGTLHLRLQAELWERRPVWDRLVYPAIVRVFRIVGGSASAPGVRVIDPAGNSATYATLPKPLAASLELGGADRVAAATRYYVHVIATIGTVADREVESMNDAVFGRESDTSSIGAVGRFVLGTVLRMSDYLQSVTAETNGRVIKGDEILR